MTINEKTPEQLKQPIDEWYLEPPPLPAWYGEFHEWRVDLPIAKGGS